MRVLVYPHDLAMGGSQTNAIEIAAQMRTLGVQPMIFGRPGVLNKRIDELGLEFIESPAPSRRPSGRVVRDLRRLAESRDLDVLHGYEWPPGLECSMAASFESRSVAVTTVMSMAVPSFLPRSVPLVVGTAQIAESARLRGRQRTEVVEPPVDLAHNVDADPAAVKAFRARWGLSAGRPLIVCVSRLADQLKAEGLHSAIAAVSGPLSDLDVQLLIVGDGQARAELERAAAPANARRARTVVFTGELFDPRVAYTAADVVVGMGGSALRALAFSKALVVQGEGGFFLRLDEQSSEIFAWQGWYGVGPAATDGPTALSAQLRPLLTDAKLRFDLGDYGRRLVVDRFSLDAAARKQLDIYENALRNASGSRATGVSLVESASRLGAYHVRRRVKRLLGRASIDDFNASPVAAHGPARPATDGTTSRGLTVYHAGVQWDAIHGTDHHMVTALSRHRDVWWVDPPASIRWWLKSSDRRPFTSTVAPGVTRIHPVGPPGASRAGARTISRWSSALLVDVHARRVERRVDSVIASTPEPVLKRWRKHSAARLVYYATDDFVAGSSLLGLDSKHLIRSRNSNVAAAHGVVAVSKQLLDLLHAPARAEVIPNGCDVTAYEGIASTAPPDVLKLQDRIAVVVGQFNERLDLGHLFAVADLGVQLLLVGPEVGREADFSKRFAALQDLDNVHWIGRRPAHELPGLLSACTVGLTPYIDDQFNRVSYPLKTLEYLAAGLRVVSSDLPAARELDPRHVALAQDSSSFARATLKALNDGPSGASERRAYARQHSWTARAAELNAFLEVLRNS